MKAQNGLLLFVLITVILVPTIYAYYDSYPLVFVHGMKGPGDSTQDKLNAFVEMEDELSVYYQKSTIEPGQTQSDICGGGVWTQSPISVRVTYYYEFPISEWEEMDINRYSQNLSDIIETIKYCSGKSKVNIIAHSLGGLVSRQYIKFYGGTDDVNKLIILGSPNHLGSIYDLSDNPKPGLGLSACIPAVGVLPPPHVVVCDDLAGSTPFYDNINSGDETPGLVKYYTIAGDIDGKGDSLVYYSGVALNGAQKNIVVLGCDHSDLREPSDCPCSFEYIKAILQNQNIDFLKADMNCDSGVDRDELGEAIMRWVNDLLSRDDLGLAIQAWSEG